MRSVRELDSLLCGNFSYLNLAGLTPLTIAVDDRAGVRSELLIAVDAACSEVDRTLGLCQRYDHAQHFPPVNGGADVRVVIVPLEGLSCQCNHGGCGGAGFTTVLPHRVQVPCLGSLVLTGMSQRQRCPSRGTEVSVQDSTHSSQQMRRMRGISVLEAPRATYTTKATRSKNSLKGSYNCPVVGVGEVMDLGALPVHTHVLRRLKTIQKAYNFHPNRGVKQITGKPELIEAFSRFQELVGLIRKCGLGIAIPYDPTGCNRPTSITGDRKSYVYFDRAGDGDVYKIGHSRNLHQRQKALQTGNHLTLTRVAAFPGGKLLEDRLKHRFKKYKTRDRNKFGKGEWFHLPPEILHPLLEELQNG